MMSFIDEDRPVYGVEPICNELPIAPSIYHHQKAREFDSSLAPQRVQRDAELRPQIQRVWDENFQVYGARKAWKQLKREHWDVARFTVARLIQDMGLRGVVRGKTVKSG